MDIIKVKNLNKTYKTFKRKEGLFQAVKSLFNRQKVITHAVQNVNFTIEKGEIVGFVGQNGAGKSTTIKMMTGVLYPSSGDVKILGFTPWTQRKKYAQHIGVVFGQKTQLWWDLPALDSFHLARGIYKIPEKEFESRLNHMIKLLRISKIVEKPVRNLSLGERMKCEFIMALLHNPQILYLDEPTIGVDALAKADIRDFLRDIQRKYMTTIILTTHDMDDIEELCKRVIIIDQGKILYDGNLTTLKNKYIKWKTVDIEFKKITNRIKFDEIVNKGEIVVSRSNYRSLRFDKRKYDVPKLIEELMKTLEIIDLTLHEPRLEAVIKEIYGKNNE